MVVPLLHTRVRESLEIALAPEEVLARLQQLAAEPFRMTIDDSDFDNIYFEMVRHQDDFAAIKISGMIRRWQGTDARLDFKGEVNVPPPNPHTQQIILGIITMISTVLYWLIISAMPLRFILDGPTFYVMAFITYLFYLFAIYFGSRGVLMNQTNDRKRWKIQQEMASIIEQIRDLQSDAQ